MTDTMHTDSPRRERGRAGLLIIDVQQGLFDRPTPIFRAEQLLDNITALIARARQQDVPVFFVQHANNKALAQGSAVWQLHPRLQPLETESVVHKTQGNAFQGTTLRDELAARGVSELVVTGLVTHGCVQATCAGAMSLGYHVILVKDGHSSYNKQAEALIVEWNQRLSAMGAELQGASDIDFSRWEAAGRAINP